MGEIEVPSRVDGKRRNLARVSDFVSWDEAFLQSKYLVNFRIILKLFSKHRQLVRPAEFPY